jgi:hypothetical protein
MHENFNGDFASASVTGNILGVPLSPTFAELASQHSSEIDICKGC